MSASSPDNAWLLATVNGNLELFQRQAGSGPTPVWVAQQPSSWLLGAGSPPIPGETVALPSSGPMLTASGQGAWVDFQISSGGQGASASLFVAPAASGENAGTWCYPTSLCASGTASLGAPLPPGYGSIAWAGSSATDPGTRVITGLPRRRC